MKKPNIFSEAYKNISSKNNKIDITDWVSWNYSTKFEDIMKTPVQTINLSTKPNNINNEIFNLNSNVE